jgi:hypothetical protein
MGLDNNIITKFVTKYKTKRKIERERERETDRQREIYEHVEFMGTTVLCCNKIQILPVRHVWNDRIKDGDIC